MRMSWPGDPPIPGAGRSLAHSSSNGRYIIQLEYGSRLVPQHRLQLPSHPGRRRAGCFNGSPETCIRVKRPCHRQALVMCHEQ
jgi:hypothetical protein